MVQKLVAVTVKNRYAVGDFSAVMILFPRHGFIYFKLSRPIVL